MAEAECGDDVNFILFGRSGGEKRGLNAMAESSTQRRDSSSPQWREQNAVTSLNLWEDRKARKGLKAMAEAECSVGDDLIEIESYRKKAGKKGTDSTQSRMKNATH